MILVNSNKIINSNEKYISGVKLANKNNEIYSKIAPPNTFKKRNPNQILRGSNFFQRKDKSPIANQIIKPFLNNSNIIKNNSISKSHIILNDHKINSSYRDKAKLLNGNNLFFNNNMNNSHNLIITPKKLIFANINSKGNKIEKIELNKYKTEKANISNRKLKEELANKKIIVINNSKNINRPFKYKNTDIKEKYDLLLNKTKNLLSKYQSIIDYYQQKEKNDFLKKE